MRDNTIEEIEKDWSKNLQVYNKTWIQSFPNNRKVMVDLNPDDITSRNLFNNYFYNYFDDTRDLALCYFLDFTSPQYFEQWSNKSFEDEYSFRFLKLFKNKDFVKEYLTMLNDNLSLEYTYKTIHFKKEKNWKTFLKNYCDFFIQKNENQFFNPTVIISQSLDHYSQEQQLFLINYCRDNLANLVIFDISQYIKSEEQNQKIAHIFDIFFNIHRADFDKSQIINIPNSSLFLEKTILIEDKSQIQELRNSIESNPKKYLTFLEEIESQTWEENRYHFPPFFHYNNLEKYLNMNIYALKFFIPAIKFFNLKNNEKITLDKLINKLQSNNSKQVKNTKDCIPYIKECIENNLIDIDNTNLAYIIFIQKEIRIDLMSNNVIDLFSNKDVRDFLHKSNIDILNHFDYLGNSGISYFYDLQLIKGPISNNIIFQKKSSIKRFKILKDLIPNKKELMIEAFRRSDKLSIEIFNNYIKPKSINQHEFDIIVSSSFFLKNKNDLILKLINFTNYENLDKLLWNLFCLNDFKNLNYFFEDGKYSNEALQVICVKTGQMFHAKKDFPYFDKFYKKLKDHINNDKYKSLFDYLDAIEKNANKSIA